MRQNITIKDKLRGRLIQMKYQGYENLLNAVVPKNVHEPASLLGMANYRSKYIPNFSTLTAPLQELTKNNAISTRTDESLASGLIQIRTTNSYLFIMG